MILGGLTRIARNWLDDIEKQRCIAIVLRPIPLIKAKRPVDHTLCFVPWISMELTVFIKVLHQADVKARLRKYC